MKDQSVQPSQLPILEKLDSVLKSTKNFYALIDAAEKDDMISPIEKDTILAKYGNEREQKIALYLLINSKASVAKIRNLLESTGNASVLSVLQPKENASRKEEWSLLQPVIADNIDRLSSHTMNLGMVLCFASGVGLITGKDREIIAKCSTLEIDQLKQFYSTVSRKQEDAYDKFLTVLKMTNNNWALSVLQISEPNEDDM